MNTEPVTDEIDLTPYRDLVKAHEELNRMDRELDKEKERIRRAREDVRLALSLVFKGAEAGVLDGRVVLRRKVTTQFATARFAKEHPDKAKQFEMPVLKYTTNTDELRKVDPELYNSYLTVRWYEAGDE